MSRSWPTPAETDAFAGAAAAPTSSASPSWSGPGASAASLERGMAMAGVGRVFTEEIFKRDLQTGETNGGCRIRPCTSSAHQPVECLSVIEVRSR